MHVSDLVARFSAAVRSDKPMMAAHDILLELANERDAVANALSYLSGRGGNALQAFYRSPELSLLKVSFPSRRRTPPHNHGAWAGILLLSGAERNTFYRRDGDGRLKRTGEALLEPGSVLPMAASAAHVAECIGDEPAVGLHVYGANVLGVERSMWDPETLEEHPLDWTLYEEFAQRASRAAAAPLAG